MKTLSLQVTYRKGTPFAAYIYLEHRPGQRSARTEEISPDLLIDYDAEGNPLGIEIVSPGYVSFEELKNLFQHLGLDGPDREEVAPLLAA